VPTLERAEQIAEWVRLSDERLQLAQLEPIDSKREDGKGHRSKSGARAASRELGLDRNKVRRSVKIASLPEDAKRVAQELGLSDNQSALEKAAKSHDPAESLKAFSESRQLRTQEDVLPKRYQRIPVDSAEIAVRALLRVFSAEELIDAIALATDQRQEA